VDRLLFCGVLGVGLVVVLSGCGASQQATPAGTAQADGEETPATAAARSGSTPAAAGEAPPPALPAPTQLPAAAGVVGHLDVYVDFPSQFVAPRTVDVWLPPGYDEQAAQRYPVLYMQDGQNIFDPSTSATTHVDWGVDEIMTELIEAGKIRPAIVVGIWSTARRVEEYMPQAPLEVYPQVRAEFVRQFGEPLGDRYLKFMVQEVKPFIDRTYRTLPDRANTFVMGSSMGGLISLYAASQYPDVFGGAGCVSTHWPAGEGRLIDYFQTVLPDPKTHRLYFDYGTEGLDAEYEPYQQRMDEVLRRAGYVKGENWVTRKFPGATHSETSWRERADIPLMFLLK
jgi:predicted alpha/beta superfamily hydrolase